MDPLDENILLPNCHLCVYVDIDSFSCFNSLFFSFELSNSATNYLSAFLLNSSVPFTEENVTSLKKGCLAESTLLIDSLVDPTSFAEGKIPNDFANSRFIDSRFANTLYWSPPLNENLARVGPVGEEMWGNTAVAVSLDTASCPLDSCPDPYGIIHIGILLDTFTNHGANNRLISWAISLSKLDRVSVSIFSGCPLLLKEGENNLVYKQLSTATSITIHFEPWLSPDKASQYDERFNSNIEVLDIVNLIQTMNVVLVTTSESNPTIHLFVYLAKLNASSNSNRPIVLMDQSNISWNSVVSNLVDIFLVFNSRSCNSMH